MELWGGHECTVNRVQDRYRDQTLLTGHEYRIEDLARFAALGITKLRYPVLWERVAPHRPDEQDWRWSDERLAEIRRLGMEPIVGLVHHGSGPHYTSLVSDDFAPLLADYAAAVARRYPETEYWTPVNEPLTTARFSALYGFWYPHACDEGQFWRALLNQIDGTRLAMREIRRVNPAARLVQTEDLGYYYATEPLAALAEHYNQRRWATWDLLTGRVTPDHPLWQAIDAAGLGDRLRAIADDPCPPDIIGANYYVTSERFLDHRVDAYPFPCAREGYHDLTAARVLDPPPLGLSGLMRQAWDRYRLPLAVTESHLGCTREEQLRWLWQSWQDCLALVRDGADVRALTAWALLGNVDWCSLITLEENCYEPGVFDVRDGTPRATAVAELLAALGRGGAAMDRMRGHPALANTGWWQRDVRLEHGPVSWACPNVTSLPRRDSGRPIVITGASGALGRAIAGACELRGLNHLLTDRATLPIDEPDRVRAFLDEHRPWAVINAAGWSRVDEAETAPAACMRANAEAPADLARACAERGIHCTLFSSDQLFDGSRDDRYVEADTPRPLNTYGRSQAAGEEGALHAAPATLVVRTAAFFSPYEPHNLAMAVERALRAGRTFQVDQRVVTPSFVPDVARICLDLAIDREAGIWHLTNGEAVDRLDFARRIAAALGLDAGRVLPAAPDVRGWRAPRPERVWLASSRGALLPPLGDAIARHADTRRRAHEHERSMPIPRDRHDAEAA